MHHYLKFSCSLFLVGLLTTACQKEEMSTPEQPAPVASISRGGRGGGGRASASRGGGSGRSGGGYSRSSTNHYNRAPKWGGCKDGKCN